MRHGLLGIASLALGGCWVGDARIDEVVWSDDDSMVAFVASFSESRGTDYESFGYKDRELGEEVFVMPSDLSSPPESVFSRGDSFSAIYLMNDAGYLLARTADDTHSELWQYFLEDGSSREIADTDDWPQLGPPRGYSSMRGVPSPDGALIALHQIGGDFDEERAMLSIVDASALEVVFPRVEIREAGVRWTSDGRLLVVQLDTHLGLSEGVLAWSRSTGVLAPIVDPECQGPETTSSDISSDGRGLERGYSFDEPVIIVEDPQDYEGTPRVPFGCD